MKHKAEARLGESRLRGIGWVGAAELPLHAVLGVLDVEAELCHLVADEVGGRPVLAGLRVAADLHQ